MKCVQVFIQEQKACEVSLLTHCITGLVTSLPFLLLLACLVAVVIIPLCGLNSSGTYHHSQLSFAGTISNVTTPSRVSCGHRPSWASQPYTAFGKA